MEQREYGLFSESKQPTLPTKTKSNCKLRRRKLKEECAAQSCFWQSVPQHKACKLLRHCCLACSTLLALQERCSLISTTYLKLYASKFYVIHEVIFLLIERNNLHVFGVRGKKGCPCALKIIKGNLALCS